MATTVESRFPICPDDDTRATSSIGCGMVSLHESFHVAGVPAGAILREMSDRALTTITCFQIPGGPLVHNESRIEFDHDVFGWTSFSYAEQGTISGLRSLATTVLLTDACRATPS